jgi:hypothetical protein
MEQFFYLIPALACPIGMGVMMWMMMRSMGGRRHSEDTQRPVWTAQPHEFNSRDEHLADLQRRQQELDEEIHQLREADKVGRN